MTQTKRNIFIRVFFIILIGAVVIYGIIDSQRTTLISRDLQQVSQDFNTTVCSELSSVKEELSDVKELLEMMKEKNDD